jgi:hypothetical protein
MTVPEDSLRANVESVDETERGLEIRVQLRNDADRALHYISDVRALDYDPGSRKLTVRLSDRGRVVVPGAANVRPPLRYIDPGSEAEITLRLPEQITKLAPSPDVERRIVAFQQQRIADAEEVAVEIAWSDVPFYEDPRVSSEDVLPSVHWQQHEETASIRRRPERASPR